MIAYLKIVSTACTYDNFTILIKSNYILPPKHVRMSYDFMRILKLYVHVVGTVFR